MRLAKTRGPYLLLASAFFVMTALPAAELRADDGAPALPEGPTFKDVLSLPSIGSARMAPAGHAVVYTLRRADWDENTYDSEVYLARRGEEPFQLTRTQDGSSTSPEWSADSRWIGFLADRGDENQIHLIRASGGEARALTQIEGGVASFRFSPDGRWIALNTTGPEPKDQEKREELYGRFAVEDAEFRYRHLWLLDLERALAEEDPVELPAEDKDDEEGEDEEDEDGEEEDEDEEQEDEEPILRRLTEGEDFTVDAFDFSPDGRRIAFSRRPDPAITSFEKTDLSILDVETGEARLLVERPGYDGNPIFSPDGEWVLFVTDNRDPTYYKNSELAKVPAAGGEPVVLTAAFDEQPRPVAWLADGIRFIAYQKTRRHLYRLDPETLAIEQLSVKPRLIWGAHYSADGSEVVLDAAEDGQVDELYRTSAEPFEPARVTDLNAEVAEYPLGTREVVEWESRDGTTIEGVLWKGEGFVRRYSIRCW